MFGLGQQPISGRLRCINSCFVDFWSMQNMESYFELECCVMLRIFGKYKNITIATKKKKKNVSLMCKLCMFSDVMFESYYCDCGHYINHFCVVCLH